MRGTPSLPAVTRMRKAVGCTRTVCGRYPAKSRRGRCSRASAWFMRYPGLARLSRLAMRHAAAVCVLGLFTASRSRFGARPSVIFGVTEAMASRLSLTERPPRWLLGICAARATTATALTAGPECLGRGRRRGGRSCGHWLEPSSEAGVPSMSTVSPTAWRQALARCNPDPASAAWLEQRSGCTVETAGFDDLELLPLVVLSGSPGSCVVCR